MATQAEIAVLRGTATQVKNESQVGGNTAQRVGGLFEGIVDALPSDEVIDGKISEAVNDIQPIVIEGNVDNAPDEEDLTSENQGGTDVLKFKDKAYNAALYSGLGRVYLRKNIVTLEGVGKNVLTQAMVNTANTIYHIQYDYDLNGQTITLPAGCVMEFDGGSITNGTLTFNGTTLKGLQDNSITGCRFNGTISNEDINVRHFGVSSSLADASNVINDIIGLLTSEKRKKMYFPAGVYTTMDSILPCDNLEIYGDGENTRIQNLAEVGESKIVIHCENYPSLSTGAARAADYTKYAITSISDDRMSIEVSGTFELSVGDISAIFVGLMAENRYYNFTYVGIVTAISGNKITFDQPIKEIPSSHTLSDAFFAPKASGSASNRFCRKNVYVHDMHLYQKTGVQSGYYCLTGGYNCRYERLKMHASTPMGSNITAHCVYKDIIADCEAGFWDAAELTYDNVFENIQIFRYDSRLNNIGFSVTNGSHNKVKNLELHGNNATVGGYFASFLSIDGLKIFDCTYYTSSSVMGILPCASDEKIKNVHFINCSVLKSSSGNHFFIVHTTRGEAENVFGNFVVGDGVSPANRFECLYTDNINVSSNLHLGSLVGASFNKYRGMSKMESAQIAFGTRFAEASLGTLITNGTVFVHSKFDIIYPDSSIATTGRNVRLYVNNKQAYINFGYTFTNFNWLNADLYITINNEKADYVLVTSNPEFHEVKTGTLDITDRSGSTLSLMMRTNANTADTFYNNYCYTEIYY